MSFLAAKAAEDEDTQKRGIVVIYYAIAQKGCEGKNNSPLQFLRALEDLPARVVATHFCYDSESMQPVLNLMSNNMDKRMLGRFRSHHGEHFECQYNLMTFGIPKECLPIDFTGQVDLSNHKMLLKTIQLEEQHGEKPLSKEQQQAACAAGAKFLIPGNMDIILGRGQHAKNTPGHLKFKQLLENYQLRYETAEKSQKTRVADQILKELKAGGCRFLKARPAGGWLEISDDAGREKINHAFRNLRSTAKKAAASSRAPSPASLPPTKRRKLDYEKSVPSCDDWAPLPLIAASGSRSFDKLTLDNAFATGFPFNLLSSDLSDETKIFAL